MEYTMTIQQYYDMDWNQLSRSFHDTRQPATTILGSGKIVFPMSAGYRDAMVASIREIKQDLEKYAERSCKLEYLAAQLSKDIDLQATRIANAATKLADQKIKYLIGKCLYDHKLTRIDERIASPLFSQIDGPRVTTPLVARWISIAGLRQLIQAAVGCLLPSRA